MAVGMKNAEDLVSVIIPVYNVKPYLQMCADTVFAQTFRNLEIIFVDDGSTDGSGEICDELALKDPRVKVIHQENGGLSDARNTGIEASTGSFLYFLDSDDAISPVTIAHLWTACIRTKADVAIGDHIRFSEEKIPEERRNFSSESLNAEEAIRRMLLNQGYTNTAWGKLFRRELWSDMRFPKGLLNEDLAVIYDVMVQVKKVVVVKDALYFYRVRKGSIMTSRIGERNLPLLDTSERVTNMIIEHYPSLRGPAGKRIPPGSPPSARSPVPHASAALHGHFSALFSPSRGSRPPLWGKRGGSSVPILPRQSGRPPRRLSPSSDGSAEADRRPSA